jgi:diamine N-acetyltransferase
MSDPTVAICYVAGDAEILDLVAPLWEELNRHHQTLSEHFSEVIAERSFADRRAELLKKSSDGRLRVDLARTGTGDCIGYCIASIDCHRTGEIDSIFVQPSFRNQRIGGTMMERALKWMDTIGTQSKILDVAWGNEQVWSFYRRYAFLPRSVVFMQKTTTKEQ